MSVSCDKDIIDSWRKNSAPWIAAVHENQIESRRLVTNQAIIDTVMSVSAKKILDMGCGEGWLARELAALGLSVTGLDVIPGLVQEARKFGGAEFQVLAYEEISDSTITERFGAVVCNFSLLGKESVEHTFKVVPTILEADGYLIVQTLHPSIEQDNYKDGWREGSWVGFNSEFCDPPPWYFRTTESWFELFHMSGYKLIQFKEPINPKTGKVASLIMVGKVSS